MNPYEEPKTPLSKSTASSVSRIDTVLSLDWGLLSIAVVIWMTLEFLFLVVVRLMPLANYVIVIAGVLPFVLGAVYLAVSVSYRWWLNGIVYVVITHSLLYLSMLTFNGVPQRLELWLFLAALLCFFLMGLCRLMISRRTP